MLISYPLLLATSFRSTDWLLEWINGAFLNVWVEAKVANTLLCWCEDRWWSPLVVSVGVEPPAREHGLPRDRASGTPRSACPLVRNNKSLSMFPLYQPLRARETKITFPKVIFCRRITGRTSVPIFVLRDLLPTSNRDSRFPPVLNSSVIPLVLRFFYFIHSIFPNIVFPVPQQWKRPSDCLTSYNGHYVGPCITPMETKGR